jgi:chromosome segregation ATPase
MGDNAEFEKLSALEARLAAALDRLSVGLGEILETRATLVDPDLTSAAVEDAQIRVDAAEAEIAELRLKVDARDAELAQAQAEAERLRADSGAVQSDVAAAQAALAAAQTEIETLRADLAAAQSAQSEVMSEADLIALKSERDMQVQRAEALEAARSADRDEMNRLLANRDTEIEQLMVQISHLREANESLEAQVSNSDGEVDAEEVQKLRSDLNEARTVVEVFYAERRKLVDKLDVMKKERNDARAALAEAQSSSAAMPDPEVVASLQADLDALRTTNGQLTKMLSELWLQSVPANEALTESAIAMENDALRAARAIDASELDRLVRQIEAGLSQDGVQGNAQEGGHA